MPKIERVAVVGLGYIGLPTAVSLAAGGFEVTGVDVDDAVVDQVNRGRVPVAEPGLSAAVSGAVATGRLSAQTSLPAADAFVLAVPTPFGQEHRPDLSHVLAAAAAVARVLRGGELIILESTVPPGTTRRVSELIAARRPDLRLPHRPGAQPDVHIAHCPERVLPGRIMIEIVSNDRIIGGLTPECAERAAELYRPFCRGQLITTDADSAELAKLAENAYRDINIAYANELSLICQTLGLDVWEIRRLANRHPRVSILRPGPGVGGHCIAVDPWFIVASAPGLARLTRTARLVNDDMPGRVAEQIVAGCARLREPRIACLGLAFKADVDDLRESPAVSIVQQVATALPGAEILAVEPHVAKLPDPLAALPNVTLADAGHAVPHADIVALLVDHSQFATIKRAQLTGKVVYDTRGMWT